VCPIEAKLHYAARVTEVQINVTVEAKLHYAARVTEVQINVTDEI
jgi:hypothetical protein